MPLVNLMNKIFTNLAQKTVIRPVSEKNLSGKRIFSLGTKGRLKKPKAKISEVGNPKQDDIVISIKSTRSSISSTEVKFKQKIEQNRRSLGFAKVKLENKVAAGTATKLFDHPEDIWAIANQFKV